MWKLNDAHLVLDLEDWENDSPHYYQISEWQTAKSATLTAELAAEWRGRCRRLPVCIVVMKERQRESKWVKDRAHEEDVCAWKVGKDEYEMHNIA